MNDKQIIRYIQEGIVIDHLPAGVAWKVAKILSLDQQKEGRISLGENHASENLQGMKSFIKIEGRSLNLYEMDLIALVAPNATLNIIRDGVVFEKKQAKLPEILKGVVKCPNLNCISNQPHENILSIIYHREGGFSCHYCGQSFLRQDFKI
ncbi:MAG: aspartate carbamoyltransferase regulatory subunit [archaeon]